MAESPIATSTTVEGAIVAVLLADVGVPATDTTPAKPSVLSLVGTRIHPFTDPQSIALPKLTYQRWGTSMDVDAGGFTNDGPTGHKVAKVQLDVWAAGLLDAKRVAKAVERTLNGYVADGPNVVLRSVRVADVRDQPGTMVPGREKQPQRITLDLRVAFLEQ